MERWVGDAAGKALNVMFEANDHDAERMLRKVIRPGKPKRLAGYKAADFDSQERDQ
jgi:hypothetical protein